MSTTADQQQTEQQPATAKSYSKEIEVGNLVSIPYNSKFMQGIVTEVTDTTITINNKENGLINAMKNKDIYKFFPGQRFDLRELTAPLLKEPIREENGKTIYKTVASKLDSRLANTPYRTFHNWKTQNPADLVQLLTGKLINNPIKGESLLPTRDAENKIIKDGPKRLVKWEAKIQLFRGKDGDLKIDTVYKNNQELNFKVYNKEVTEEEAEKLKKGQSVAVTRTRNDGGEFKVFAKLDKDLNRLVTFPYSVKVEEIMQKAYAKKEGETNGTSQAQNTSNEVKEAQAPSQALTDSPAPEQKESIFEKANRERKEKAASEEAPKKRDIIFENKNAENKEKQEETPKKRGIKR